MKEPKKISRKISSRILSLFFAVCLVTGMMPATQVQAATEQAVVAETTIDKSTTYDGEAVTLDLALTGKTLPGVVVPNDIILCLDCSGSMKSYKRFEPMKTAAKHFIDLMDFSKHRVGIVDYASTAPCFDLSTDADALKSYIDGIQNNNGGTRTDLAITKAEEMLSQKRADAIPTIVILSDGEATRKDLTEAAATSVKSKGVVIYTVAMLSDASCASPEAAAQDGANQDMMKLATSAEHHHYVGTSGVTNVYEEIAKQMGEANVQNAIATIQIDPHFELVAGSTDSNIPRPDISGDTLTWKMNELKGSTTHVSYQLKPKAGTPSGTYNNIVSGQVEYTTTDDSVNTITISPVSIQVYYTPVIDSISQTDFELTAGDTVTVKGSGFESNSVVKLGNSKISDATVVDANTITFTMPSHSQGSADLTIENPGGKTASVTVRFIAQPTITSISPANGPYEGGTKLTIQGTNFMQGAKVTFDGVEGTVGSTYSGKLYVVTPPAQQEGAVDVVLTNPDGTFASVTDGFSYDAKVPEPTMTLTGITPASSVEGEEQKATLTGTLMKNITKVQVGGVDATLGSMYDSKVYVYIPGTLSPGTYDVVATDNSGNVQTLPAAYTVTEKPVTPPEPAFTLTGVSPASSVECHTQQITISGTNLSNTSKVSLGGTEISLVSAGNKSVIASVPGTIAAGTYDITVADNQGNTETLAGAYTVTPKPTEAAFTLTAFTPGTSVEEANTKCTLTGTDLKNVEKVQIGGEDATLGSQYDAKMYVFVPTTLTAGTYDVVAFDMYGNTKTLAGACEVTPKPVEPAFTLTGVSPASSVECHTQQITISGTNLSNTSKVSLGGTEISLVSAANKSVVASVPGTIAAGTYDITVTDNQGNTETLAGAYTVTPKPTEAAFTLTAFTPGTSVEEANTKCTLTGTDLKNVEKVQIGGEDATLGSQYDAKMYVFVPTTLTAGTYDVVAFDMYGNTKTLAGACEVTEKPAEPPFTISSISPASSMEGTETAVTISGSKLENTEAVKIGGVEFAPTSVSETKVKAVVPGTIAAGQYDVILRDTAGNEEALSAGYTVTEKPKEAPFTLTDITPATSKEGESQKCTITGTSMKEVVKVQIGGEDATLGSQYDAKMYIYVPTTLGAGTYDVVAFDQYGNTKSLTDAYIVTEKPVEPLFTVTAITPTTSEEGVSQKCTVTGTDLDKVASVKIGGQEVTFGSRYAAKFYIYTPEALSAGTYDVVFTAEDGSQQTMTGAYTVTAKPVEPLFTATAITPATSEEGVSQKCTVTGTDLDKVTSVKIGGQEATFGSRYATKFYVYTPTTLSAGTYDVVFTAEDGSQQTMTGAYTVTAKPVEPSFTLTSFTPASGKAGVSQKCTLKGTTLKNVKSVQIGGVTAKLGSQYDAKVYVYTPASLSTGTYDVVAYDKDGNAVTLKNAYTVQ